MAQPRDALARAPLGGDRLLSIEDVASATGLCDVIASQVMDETGKAFVLHRRKLVFEQDLIAYLRGLGVA